MNESYFKIPGFCFWEKRQIILKNKLNIIILSNLVFKYHLEYLLRIIYLEIGQNEV